MTQRAKAPRNPVPARAARTNPRVQAQTRKVLRTHYAAKYRAR